MREFRKLVGDTRITDQEVYAILKNPRIPIKWEEVEAMGEIIGQEQYERKVWIPRRLVRHLAAEGSRLEIASMLVMMARRMVNRFGRARVSARMIAILADAQEKHVRTALLSLQEKRLIQKNQQAERWSVNRWGSLYDFPEDLSIDPKATERPIRATPRRVPKVFANVTYATVMGLLAACTPLKAPLVQGQETPVVTTSMQKGADLINKDPSLQLEPQQLMPIVGAMAPPEPSEMARERRRLAAAARLLEIDQGPQGACYRNCWSNVHSAAAAAEALSLYGYQTYQSTIEKYPPHVPAQAPWNKRRQGWQK